MVVVVEVDVEVVVVEVVVVVGPHAGSVGSVQEQSVVLQLRRTALLHALRAMPFKPAHPAAISSEQTFLLHGPVAVATEETKTPAPSATAANVTTALLVIVAPPYGRRSQANIEFGALPARDTFSTRVWRFLD
jgi:hypothetical protein